MSKLPKIEPHFQDDDGNTNKTELEEQQEPQSLLVEAVQAQSSTIVSTFEVKLAGQPQSALSAFKAASKDPGKSAETFV